MRAAIKLRVKIKVQVLKGLTFLAVNAGNFLNKISLNVGK
jgi:hypothetical protein